MKRAVLLALMIALVFLTGCGREEMRMETFENWRQEFIAADSHSVTAEVTAIAEESETVFLLRCDHQKDRTSIEVLEPKAVAGVTAHISDEEKTLCYDGTVLALGQFVPQEVSPLAALPRFFDFLENGHVEGAWTETVDGEETLVTELENERGYKMTLWQDGSMQPRFAAIRSGDITELKIQIEKIE